jgi:hypothetical protein
MADEYPQPRLPGLHDLRQRMNALGHARTERLRLMLVLIHFLTCHERL